MLLKAIAGIFGSHWRLKRLCNETRQNLLKNILIQIYYMYQYENASGIAWNSRFAGEPCLPHGIKGIFITGGASIGTNCVIFQQVTIGENDLPHSKGCGSPTIGNNCYIGAGAKIIGNVRVGNNVVIGANAVVYKDVPDNSVVLFGEQKVVTHEAPLDTRHYSWRGKWTYYSNGKWHPVTDQLILAKLFQSLST